MLERYGAMFERFMAALPAVEARARDMILWAPESSGVWFWLVLLFWFIAYIAIVGAVGGLLGRGAYALGSWALGGKPRGVRLASDAGPVTSALRSQREKAGREASTRDWLDVKSQRDL